MIQERVKPGVSRTQAQGKELGCPRHRAECSVEVEPAGARGGFLSMAKEQGNRTDAVQRAACGARVLASKRVL